MKKAIKRHLESKSQTTQGIILMLTACFWFSVMATLIRYISEGVPPFEMVFFRNIASVICLTPWILDVGVKNIRTSRWKLYALRAFFGVFGMSLLFYAFSIIPLTNAISLTFTVPLITTLFAMFFLGEKVSFNRWMALLTGFLGVLVILQPGTNSFQYTSLLVLITTCSWSASNILIKKLTATDDPKIIVIIMTLIMMPLSLPLALTVWVTPTLEQLGLLFVLGWVSNQAQINMTNAYSKADMKTVLPFDFSRLVFITLFAFIFFGEIIDITTLIGACIIFISSVVVVRSESKKNRTPAPLIDD